MSGRRAFGDGPFAGSMGGQPLVAPMVGIVSSQPGSDEHDVLDWGVCGTDDEVPADRQCADFTVPLDCGDLSKGTIELDVARLGATDSANRINTSALAEELIDEGLRLRRHPLVVFRDGATGRRAGLVGGPDIWEIIAGTIGGDVPASDRVNRTAELLGLAPLQVSAALDYYAAFSDEIDAAIAANEAAAEEAEARWRKRQQLLAR